MAKDGRIKSEESGDIYRDIVVSTNTLIWRTDNEGRFTFINPAWEKNSNYHVEEMKGRPFSEFQVSESAEHYINAFRNCLIGESIIGHETSYFSKDGNEIHLVINMTPLYDSIGSIIGTQGTAHDITEQKHADRLLQYISAKDELTGLYNLHTFLSMAEQQIKTAAREKKEILIIYAGVDDAESVRTIHDDEAVNMLLVDTSNILRKTFRETDILAQTGGEEFVISTLVTSRDTEEMILSRLQENLDKYNSDKSGSLKLSLSFGAAFYNPEDPVPIEKVLTDAEERMYENKKDKG
jgi:diguanylate cyclase (GGDEF)-like protein/PAS domain S-box-containing protein